ncbi:hypothetical protein ACQKIC_05755 [Peribacillus sp. NPDC046944]|uniref:hypothetical protein n=2 Tax=Peribacillus TaxID=2675229 RepID=UPI003CFBED24
MVELMHFIWMIVALVLFFVVIESSVTFWLNHGTDSESKDFIHAIREKIIKKSAS